MKRTCTKCMKAKSLEHFRIRTRKRPRPRSVCKPCEALAERNRKLAMTPEQRTAMRRIKRDRELSNVKVYRLQTIRRAIRMLGLVGESDKIMTDLSKKRVCAICRSKPRARLHIDHNHTTGRYRGLLCDNCNVGLGHFKDSPALLRKAIAYLAGKV